MKVFFIAWHHHSNVGWVIVGNGGYVGVHLFGWHCNVFVERNDNVVITSVIVVVSLVLLTNRANSIDRVLAGICVRVLEGGGGS